VLRVLFILKALVYVAKMYNIQAKSRVFVNMYTVVSVI